VLAEVATLVAILWGEYILVDHSMRATYQRTRRSLFGIAFSREMNNILINFVGVTSLPTFESFSMA